MTNEGTITDVRLQLGGRGGPLTVLGSLGNGSLDQGTVDALLNGYSLEDIASQSPDYSSPLAPNPNEPLVSAYVDWPPSNEFDQGGTLVLAIDDVDPNYTHERNKEPLNQVNYGDEVRFTQFGSLVLVASDRDPWTYGLISQLQGEGSLYIEKQSGAKAKLSGGIDQVFVMSVPAGQSLEDFAETFGPFYKSAFGGGVKIKDANGGLIGQYGGL